jgi:hypothetical protein
MEMSLLILQAVQPAAVQLSLLLQAYRAVWVEQHFIKTSDTQNKTCDLL